MASIPVPAGSANPNAPVHAAAPAKGHDSHNSHDSRKSHKSHKSHKSRKSYRSKGSKRGPIRRFTNAIKYVGKRVRNTVSQVFSRRSKPRRRSRRNSLPTNVAVPQDSNAPPGPVKAV